tara:strand:- start:196 stop:390 length:195 start_codon:yes stop_codon:yes gene_type:complete
MSSPKRPKRSGLITEDAKCLDLIEKDMRDHPERVRPADDLLAEMEELVGQTKGNQSQDTRNSKD